MDLVYFIIPYMNLSGLRTILEQAYGSSISYNPLYELVRDKDNIGAGIWV